MSLYILKIWISSWIYLTCCSVSFHYWWLFLLLFFAGGGELDYSVLSSLSCMLNLCRGHCLEITHSGEGQSHIWQPCKNRTNLLEVFFFSFTSKFTFWINRKTVLPFLNFFESLFSALEKMVWCLCQIIMYMSWSWLVAKQWQFA